MPKTKLITLCGMWRSDDQDGREFFKGRFGKIPDGFELKEGAKLFLFENKNPKQANSPTHILYVEDTRPAGSGEGPGDKKGDRPMGFEGFGKPEDATSW